MEEQQLPLIETVYESQRPPRFFLLDEDFWMTVMMVILVGMMVGFAGLVLFGVVAMLVSEPITILVVGGPVALVLGISYLCWKFEILDKMFGNNGV